MKTLRFLALLIVFNTYSQKQDFVPIKPIRSYNIKTINNNNGIQVYVYKDDSNPLNGRFKIDFFVKDKNARDIEINENGIKRKSLKYDLPNRGYKRTNIDKNGSFKKGFKDGLWKTYFKNKLVKIENWSNGLIFGKYKVTDNKGKLLYQTNFGSQGNGKYKDFYYNSGSLKQEGNYENGKKQGEWCDYDEQGKLVKTTKYDKGVIKE